LNSARKKAEKGLADAAAANIPQWNKSNCVRRVFHCLDGAFTRKSFVAQHPDIVENVLRSLIDSVTFIQEPANKNAVLKSRVQWLRLPKAKDALEGYEFMRRKERFERRGENFTFLSSRFPYLPRNIPLQLLDRKLLIGDDGFDEIADGHDADEFAFIRHRQMSNAPIRHDRHAFFDRLIRVSINNVGGHDFSDESIRRGSAEKNYLARVIPLRNDAGELCAFHDYEGADFFFGHQTQGLEDRRSGIDRPNVATFDCQDVSNCFHGRPPLGKKRLKRILQPI
jgi:hypothetical protein